MFSVVLTHSISLLFLPDPLHDVPEELDNLLLTLLRRLEDVEDGLGGRLVLGQHPLQPHVERLRQPATLSLLSGLRAGLCLLGSGPPPDPLLRF